MPGMMFHYLCDSRYFREWSNSIDIHDKVNLDFRAH